MFEIKDNMTDKSFNKHVVKLKKHTTNNSKRDISTLIKRRNKKHIRVLQYNTFLRQEIPYIMNLYDGQKVRSKDIPRAIKKRDTNSGIDIVVLNEVFHKSRDELLSSLETWKYQSKVVSSTFTPETSGVFILSKTPILDESSIVFSSSKHWDYLASKGVTYIKTKIRGVITHVFATHMQATYGDNNDEKYNIVRRDQIREMINFKNSINIKLKDLVIFAGDFNIPIGTEEYKSLNSELNTRNFDTINDKSSSDIVNQLNGLSNEASEKGCLIRYLKTHECTCCSDELIDYVFVLKGYMKVKFISLDVWTDFKPTRQLCGYFYNNLKKKVNDHCPHNLIDVKDLSDHYPVVLTVEI